MRKLLGNTLAIGAIFILLTPVRGFAEPSISRVSGTFAHGLPVTITGTGFGTKNPAKPVVWADFEASIQPTSLGTITKWNQIENMSRVTGEAAVGDGVAKGTPGVAAWTLRADSTDLGFNWSDTGQKSYLFRIHKKNFLILAGSTYPNQHNWKIFRVWPAAFGFPNLRVDTHAGCIEVEGISGSGGCVGTGVRSGSTDWVIEEHLLKGSTLNVEDGSYELRYGGVTKANVAIQTREDPGDTAPMTLFYAAHFVAANKSSWPNPGSWQSTNSAWVDDIYLDNTWARVMLCDTHTYSTCTKLAPQIPSAWSDRSITITVNQGIIQNLRNAYLYVIDGDGKVNLFGFPIPTDPPPAPPKNLRLQ